MKKFTVLLLIFGIFFVFAGCGKEKIPEASSGGDGVFVIKSPYCDLKYPEKWQDQVDIFVETGSFCTVEFTDKRSGTPLFDLVFGREKGNLYGTLILDGENIVIRIVDYELDQNAEDYQTLCMMQEDVNVILQHLTEDYTVVINEIVEKNSDPSVMSIQTPLVTLYYPQKWAEKVTVTSGASGATFVYGEFPLFDLTFGGGEGVLLGTYLAVPIRITSYTLDRETVSENIYDEYCAMQEDVNVILQYLMEDSDFVINK